MTQEQAGQGEYIMGIQIDYKWIPVYDTQWASETLHLNRQYVTQLCESGKLIATKISGKWWVHEQRYNDNYVSGIPF